MHFMPVVVGVSVVGLVAAFKDKVLPKKNGTDAKVEQAFTCAFCQDTDLGGKIIKNQSIGETKHIRVLLDNSPIVPGHLLITTTQSKKKAHELSDSEALAEHEALKKVAGLFAEKYGTREYLQLQKNGRPAGQSVPHYHNHVYPMSLKNTLFKAHRNFFLKFATGLSSKLKGEKLQSLKNELQGKLDLSTETKTRVEEYKESVEQSDAECALCPTSQDPTKKPSLVTLHASDTPIAPGHVIISTRRHVGKAHERTPEEVIACHQTLKKVVTIFKEKFQTEDYVQIQESGVCAGQKGRHFYMHLYPVVPTKYEYVNQFLAFVRYIISSNAYLSRLIKLKGEAVQAAQNPFKKIDIE
ncbi:MAG: hypothetical protein JWO53_108 [Chlamydiia bacterium]|nr:hypothetical protein [Chlamydiia bacterium]